MEAVYWVPETIEIELNQSLGIEVPTLNIDKLNTAISILTTDRFFKILPDFLNFCNVLFGYQLQPDILMLPHIDAVSWGVTEAILISPPDDVKNIKDAFDPEIEGYVQKLIEIEGLISPPYVLQEFMPDAAVNKLKIQQNFLDDVSMFQFIYEVNKGKSERINSLTVERLKNLFKQVHSMPVVNFDKEKIKKFTSGLIKQIEKSIPK